MTDEEELALLIGIVVAKRHEAADPADYAVKLAALLLAHERIGLAMLVSLAKRSTPTEVAASWEAVHLAERTMTPVLRPALTTEATEIYQRLVT